VLSASADFRKMERGCKGDFYVATTLTGAGL
jgi:hypothetical protein